MFTVFYIFGIMCRGPGVYNEIGNSRSFSQGSGLTVVIPVIIIFTGGCILLIGEWKKNKGTLASCIIWLLCPLFCLAGYGRTNERGIESPLKSVLSRSSDAVVRGIISDISLRNDGYVLTISECAADIAQQTLKTEKLNIITGSDIRFDKEPEIGDMITAEGKLYPFEAASNYGQFDSELYYMIRGIDAKMYAGSVSFDDHNIEGADDNPGAKYAFLNILYKIRRRLTDGILEVLPQKEAGVLIAMLTGERGLLDSELKELYSDGGIAHILSISALHVTLLGMGFFRLLMFLIGRLRLSCFLTMVLMLCYGTMTGFSVSTRRAVIMLIVSLSARMIGKTYDRLSACGFAALIILLIQPLYIYDAGFRLSFIAVIGINVIMWVIEVYDIRKPAAKAFLPCIAVWVFILPVVMGTYYEISVWSILVNPLILIFMAILLVSGAIAGVITSKLFAGPVYFILKMYEELCLLEMKLPFSKIVTGAPSGIGVIIYYTVLIVVMNTLIRRKRPSSLIGLMLCLCIFIRIKAPYEVYFLDVGQGDSAFIACDGKNIMVDGGSSNISDVGNYRLIPFLKYMGVNRLDAVIISHTDADHVNGILKMAEEGYPKIKTVYMGNNVSDDDKAVISLREAGVEIVKLGAGDIIETGGSGLYLTAIAPESEMTYKDANSASLTVLVEYKNISMLMTGDSGNESEARYVNRLEKDVSVLKVAHHGSKYSTSELLLDKIHPAAASISCSKTNSYGHPSPECLERLEKVETCVYTTPKCGMISVYYRGGDRFTVNSYK